MPFVIGLLVGVVLGGVAGVALSASGVLHPGNCKVCGFFAKECKVGGGKETATKPAEPPPTSKDVRQGGREGG